MNDKQFIVPVFGLNQKGLICDILIVAQEDPLICQAKHNVEFNFIYIASIVVTRQKATLGNQIKTTISKYKKAMSSMSLKT